MRQWLEHQAATEQVDVIHSHGLWMMPNVYPGDVCRRHAKCRLFVSPRGTLSQWALGSNAVLKKAFWLVRQGRAVQRAACLHATAESEYADIRRIGLTQPVCVVPNGIDVYPLDRPASTSRRQLLFLGRIHPVKGLDVLLKAWRVVQDRFPDWDLHLVGPDDRGHFESIRGLATAVGAERVMFRGPLYGEQKRRAFSAASVYVLPTKSENFGITVAEALAAGTPAIVTTAAPWSGLEPHNAGWWIEPGVDALVAALERALATSPSRLAEMGLHGRDWMQRDFGWHSVAEQLAAAYTWVLNGGPVPASVRLN